MLAWLDTKPKNAVEYSLRVFDLHDIFIDRPDSTNGLIGFHYPIQKENIEFNERAYKKYLSERIETTVNLNKNTITFKNYGSNNSLIRLARENLESALENFNFDKKDPTKTQSFKTLVQSYESMNIMGYLYEVAGFIAHKHGEKFLRPDPNLPLSTLELIKDNKNKELNIHDRRNHYEVAYKIADFGSFKGEFYAPVPQRNAEPFLNIIGGIKNSDIAMNDLHCIKEHILLERENMKNSAQRSL